MECSIIVPTYNTRATTLACIRSLLQAPPKISHEIIVVDNGTVDGTPSALSEEFPHIILLRNSANLGFAKACNRGASVAQGNFMCFLNSDTLNAGAAIGQLTRWLSDHPRTGIVGPELRSSDNQLIQMS